MELSNYVKVFKALSSEQRLKIFMMIYNESLKGSKKGAVIPVGKTSCCCPVERAFSKVCECMRLSRSTVSHHFKELQSAGLITCERDGQMYRCKVNEKVVNSIKDFLK